MKGTTRISLAVLVVGLAQARSLTLAETGATGPAAAPAEDPVISCEDFAAPLVALERENMQRRCPIDNADWNAPGKQRSAGQVDWAEVQRDYVNFCVRSGIAPSGRAWYRDHYVETRRKVLADNPDCLPQAPATPNPAPNPHPPAPPADPNVEPRRGATAPPPHISIPPMGPPGGGSSESSGVLQSGWAIYCQGGQIWGRYAIYPNLYGTCNGPLGWYMWIFSTLDPQKLYVMCPDRKEYDNQGREYIAATWELHYTGIDFHNDHGDEPKYPTQWIPQWAGEMKLTDPGTCAAPPNQMRTTWQNFGARDAGWANWQPYNGPWSDIAFTPAASGGVAGGGGPPPAGGPGQGAACGGPVGDWQLSREGAAGGGVIASMRIDARGTAITVYGAGWSGQGSFDGAAGYYDWQFTDGRRGRTTLSLDGNCVLHGQVRGSGLDWDYQARRR